MVKFELEGYALKNKTVTKHGNGAHLIAPKAWIGKRVALVLLEEED